MTERSAVQRVLVVGGGFAGMTAALELDRAGFTTELAEIDPEWRSYGAGISLHGATFRVLARIGILDRFLALGAVAEGFDIRSPVDDRILVTLPTPNVAPGIPGGGAVLRPVLAAILRDAVVASRVRTRIGVGLEAIGHGASGVEVTFADGSSAHYDLVVGADGIGSRVRHVTFPDAPEPHYLGQGGWRALVPTPPGLERGAMWQVKRLKAGINRVSSDLSYVFVTENRPRNDRIEDGAMRGLLAALLAQFESPILRRIRDGLGPDSGIVYRPLMQLMLPRPWWKRAVVLIGDAAHSTAPHLAAGACIGMEDAVVLVDTLVSRPTLEEALQAFEERRWERCRMVVENSGRLCGIEVEGGDMREHTEIMRASMTALAEPI